MKKFIEITRKTDNVVDGLMQYDNGQTMRVTMTRYDYDILESQREIEKLAKENKDNAKRILELTEEIADLKYSQGYDSGYDVARDDAYYGNS